VRGEGKSRPSSLARTRRPPRSDRRGRADPSFCRPGVDRSDQHLTPAWSPDNTGIAFTSSRTGNTDIYTINPDGTNFTRQTNNPSLDLFPDW
jgi:WD40 repeat protein